MASSAAGLGLLLTLAILRPIAALRWEAPAEGGLLERTEDQASDYRKNQQEALASFVSVHVGTSSQFCFPAGMPTSFSMQAARAGL